jgi:hypothetical protein
LGRVASVLDASGGGIAEPARDTGGREASRSRFLGRVEGAGLCHHIAEREMLGLRWARGEGERGWAKLSLSLPLSSLAEESQATRARDCTVTGARGCALHLPRALHVQWCDGDGRKARILGVAFAVTRPPSVLSLIFPCPICSHGSTIRAAHDNEKIKRGICLIHL